MGLLTDFWRRWRRLRRGTSGRLIGGVQPGRKRTDFVVNHLGPSAVPIERAFDGNDHLPQLSLKRPRGLHDFVGFNSVADMDIIEAFLRA